MKTKTVTNFDVFWWMTLLIDEVLDYLDAFAEGRTDAGSIHHAAVKGLGFADFLDEIEIGDSENIEQLAEWFHSIVEDF